MARKMSVRRKKSNSLKERERETATYELTANEIERVTQDLRKWMKQKNKSVSVRQR